MSGNANGTSLVTVVVTPRDRYTGTVECIDTLYEYTWSPFNLLVLDLGYPRGLLKKVRQALRGRPGADLVSLGRIIPMEAFRSILPRIDTGYIVFLDNDSRVTPGWLEPLLECAAAGANVVTPLTLEREGLDEGAPLRNHIYTSELRQVEVEKVPYLIEYKPYRREPPEKLPRHQAPTDLFELHCVFIETEYLRRIELRPMVVREHIDMAMQLRRAGARLMAEPRSVIIFDNLNQRMALPDMRFFFFRWGAGLLEQSERLFERTWGYRFYSEQSMRNWAFRRKVYLLARYFHVPNRYANYLTNGLNRLRQQWDPLPDPIGSSRPFFEEAPARTAHNAVGAAGGRMKRLLGRTALGLCSAWLGQGGPGELRTILAQALLLRRGRSSVEIFHQRLDAFFTHLDRAALLARVGYPRIRERLLRPGGYKHVLRRANGDPLLSLALRLSYRQDIGFDFLQLLRGEQIPPHGHWRAASGFYLIEGQVAVRHYHPEGEQDGDPLLRLTMDRVLDPGGFATESGVRDNIHWLCGRAEQSVLFRVNVKNLPAALGDTRPGSTRMYIDPRGPADGAGLIRARYIDEARARAIPPFGI